METELPDGYEITNTGKLGIDWIYLSLDTFGFWRWLYVGGDLRYLGKEANEFSENTIAKRKIV
jgi:hypothetical protein